MLHSDHGYEWHNDSELTVNMKQANITMNWTINSAQGVAMVVVVMSVLEVEDPR